jgi:hypothetical protein
VFSRRANTENGQSLRIFSSDYRARAALREVVGEKLLELMGIKIMVPKKGLEPPHPCGYMDLNHARLPIPPLRRVTFRSVAPLAGAVREEQTSILQTVHSVSNTQRTRTRTIVRSRDWSRVVGIVMANPSKLPPEVVSHLRRLAHDLSNSLETIMQASYLLSQMELEPTGKKWVELIDEAAQDAAHINRELREVLRG